jgi:hypothetical protein
MASFNSSHADWCGITQDYSFGASVNGCRGDFDFTLLFEEAFLALVPSTVFLLLIPPRLVQLWTGCPISQPLSVSAYEIFGISVISRSVEVIKLSKSIS